MRVKHKLKSPEAVHMLKVMHVHKCCPGAGLRRYGSQYTGAVLGNRSEQTDL